MHVDSLRCRVEGVKLHQTNRPTDVCTVMPYQCPSTGDMIVLDGRHARVFAYYNLHPIHITSIHVVRPFRAHSTVYNPQAMTPAPHTGTSHIARWTAREILPDVTVTVGISRQIVIHPILEFLSREG